MTVYKQVELKDGQPLQFLGVYSLRWLSEWGEPTVGFLEVDYRLNDALDDLASVQLIDNTGSEADDVRKEIENILRKLTGDIQVETEDAAQ